ncbi:ATP-binding cassette domain-containing protein [Mobiluncus porci]|uniref:ATP-binding cassette domain-containing protein n=1 Tax=Mobiluncus porci TaxID=2652278 RepID=UPI003B847055
MYARSRCLSVGAPVNRLGLSQIVHEKVFTLSGGEQQRVALARCILKPGRLILADEPTGALDPKLANVVLREILQLQHEYHKSLIVVTHDRNVADACDLEVQLSPLD